MRERQAQTLLQFATDGPMNLYQVWQSIPKDNRSVRSSYQKAVAFLMTHHLIRVKETGSWFGGRSKKVYQLTVDGFLEILRLNTASSDIKKAINSNKDILPEYFELWDSFEQLDVGDTAIKLVRYAAKKLQSGLPSFPERIENRDPTLSDWLPRLAIYPYQALIEGSISQGEAQRWHRMLLAVPKAEQLFVSTLKWIIASHESGMKSYSKALETHYKLRQALVTARWMSAVVHSGKFPAS